MPVAAVQSARIFSPLISSVRDHPLSRGIHQPHGPLIGLELALDRDQRHHAIDGADVGLFQLTLDYTNIGGFLNVCRRGKEKVRSFFDRLPWVFEPDNSKFADIPFARADRAVRRYLHFTTANLKRSSCAEQRVSLRGDNGAVGFQRKITVSSVALSPHRLDDEESVPLDRQVKRVTCGLNFSLEKIRSLIADRYQPARPFAARRA